MVGATACDPVPPAMSRQCSTAELRAHRRKERSSTSRLLDWQEWGIGKCVRPGRHARAVRDAPPSARYDASMEFLPTASDHEALDYRPPQRQTAPVVVASPHSGSVYPARFLAQTAVPLAALRRAEDAFVDDLFSGGPRLGLTLLA